MKSSRECHSCSRWSLETLPLSASYIMQVRRHSVCFIDDEFSDVRLSFFFFTSRITVSSKRKYTLLSSRLLKTDRGQMKSRGCTKLTIELVQLNGGCDTPPPFPLVPLVFWVLGFAESVYFLLVETVAEQVIFSRADMYHKKVRKTHPANHSAHPTWCKLGDTQYVLQMINSLMCFWLREMHCRGVYLFWHGCNEFNF